MEWWCFLGIYEVERQQRIHPDPGPALDMDQITDA